MEIVLEVEAENDEEAELKAQTLIVKRVTECEFGHNKNDRASVTREFTIMEKTGWEKTDDDGNDVDMFDEDGIDLETQ